MHEYDIRFLGPRLLSRPTGHTRAAGQRKRKRP
jgi:hypothetical protein